MKAKRLDEYQVKALIRALEVAREIKALDKKPDLDSASGYAYALGRANGLADDIVLQLEYALGVK